MDLRISLFKMIGSCQSGHGLSWPLRRNFGKLHFFVVADSAPSNIKLLWRLLSFLQQRANLLGKGFLVELPGWTNIQSCATRLGLRCSNSWKHALITREGDHTRSLQSIQNLAKTFKDLKDHLIGQKVLLIPMDRKIQKGKCCSPSIRELLVTQRFKIADILRNQCERPMSTKSARWNSLRTWQGRKDRSWRRCTGMRKIGPSHTHTQNWSFLSKWPAEPS